MTSRVVGGCRSRGEAKEPRPDNEVASSEVAETELVIRPRFTGGIGNLRELLILNYNYFIYILHINANL
jgi:hypothetical protein